MKLSGYRANRNFTPLKVGSAVNIAGGSAVQFYDGTSYTPNREGAVSSPILISHSLSVVNPDEQHTGLLAYQFNTLWYENGMPITASSTGYELIGRELKVKKNIPAGTSVAIKAVTKFVDPRTSRVYEKEDEITLRTLLKSESQYQLILSQHGIVFFDGHRNPNTQTAITATLNKGSREVADLTGITLKWLNADGLDAVENELYGESVSANGRTLTIDKTYIDKETIRCEAWQGTKLLATEQVTFLRKFNSVNWDVSIPQIPVYPGTQNLTCSITGQDMLGAFDVDGAFLVNWIVSENGSERSLGVGANITVPVSSINFNANPVIFPDVKRREAYAALVLDDNETLITDDADNVLVSETYGV